MKTDILDHMKIDYEILLDGTRASVFDCADLDDENPNHCVLTITSPNGASEEFDCWNDKDDPHNSTPYNVMNQLRGICNDALNASWEYWGYLEEGDYSREAIETIQDRDMNTLFKLETLGFSERDIESIVEGE